MIGLARSFGAPTRIRRSGMFPWRASPKPWWSRAARVLDILTHTQIVWAPITESQYSVEPRQCAIRTRKQVQDAKLNTMNEISSALLAMFPTLPKVARESLES
jgi:hypothetical protein